MRPCLTPPCAPAVHALLGRAAHAPPGIMKIVIDRYTRPDHPPTSDEGEPA